jgi:hypothetical protein
MFAMSERFEMFEDDSLTLQLTARKCRAQATVARQLPFECIRAERARSARQGLRAGEPGHE